MKAPHYGDGRTYSGECLCCGKTVTGRIAKSRPGPYMESLDPFGGPPRVRCIFVVTDERGAHDVPLRSAVVV